MTLKPKGIVFDADNVPALAEFLEPDNWLRGEVDSGKRFAHLIPEEVALKHIFIIKVPEGKTAKNRCHIDFDTDDRTAEVEHLVSAGATKVADHTLHGFTWTVMQDPGGNEFCVSDG